MPLWSAPSPTSGSSICIAPTVSCGRCSSLLQRSRCGTRCGRRRNFNGTKEKPMKRLSPRYYVPIVSIALLGLAMPARAHAFCGFYVGKSDTSLYNHASQVVMVRHDGKTVLSLMNDYQGEPSDFALVVPVPEVLQRGQVHIGDRALFNRIDAYSSPRLVEYYDANPCQRELMMREGAAMAAPGIAAPANAPESAANLGVTIEAQYSVGEYDIIILSAKQSDGLEEWLYENGYHIPAGAGRALKPYLRQDMKFFVAKVNL